MFLNGKSRFYGPWARLPGTSAYAVFRAKSAMSPLNRSHPPALQMYNTQTNILLEFSGCVLRHRSPPCGVARTIGWFCNSKALLPILPIFCA
jgi:hypothetical protein